ncbi:PIG-L deacetylase family protein [Streptomyces kronopolitis]|uniref:GlcNAc-PI de-N-acetylase n=1 Tax=Streptomyces kronopolitis TaxID=1612435 RepID=A0ABQ2JAC4_9ACTN|nr:MULTISPECIES: PIG-L deacetylase family protein [Streptomyces]MCL6297696.1 PIG-L family deacetylase [Streptomyces kronopolitis]GGN41737.1 GlcNAc-PI de-N-acetylase [Streptomyces kronopolitis]GLW16187.1 GlcNAc-PI de-N-acetylase [Streptomyces sp. NBRC 13847]
MPAEHLSPMPKDWQRALAVVAHPDDLEYGAAAAIAEWTAAGREVSYLLVTRGEAGIDGLAPAESAAVREEEQRAGAALVGVHTVEFLDHHHDGVIEPGRTLRRDLSAAIRRHRPELLVTLNHHDTWGGGRWNTPDHRVVGRAVLDAAGDAGNRWIFRDLTAAKGLAPWNGVRWVAVAGSPHPTHAAEVGPGIDRAVASLAAHATYIKGLRGAGQDPHTYARTFIEQMLRNGGERYRGHPATLFQVFPR